MFEDLDDPDPPNARADRRRDRARPPAPRAPPDDRGRGRRGRPRAARSPPRPRCRAAAPRRWSSRTNRRRRHGHRHDRRPSDTSDHRHDRYDDDGTRRRPPSHRADALAHDDGHDAAAARPERPLDGHGHLAADSDPRQSSDRSCDNVFGVDPTLASRYTVTNNGSWTVQRRRLRRLRRRHLGRRPRRWLAAVHRRHLAAAVSGIDMSASPEVCADVGARRAARRDRSRSTAMLVGGYRNAGGRPHARRRRASRRSRAASCRSARSRATSATRTRSRSRSSRRSGRAPPSLYTIVVKTKHMTAASGQSTEAEITYTNGLAFTVRMPLFGPCWTVKSGTATVDCSGDRSVVIVGPHQTVDLVGTVWARAGFVATGAPLAAGHYRSTSATAKTRRSSIRRTTGSISRWLTAYPPDGLPVVSGDPTGCGFRTSDARPCCGRASGRIGVDHGRATATAQCRGFPTRLPDAWSPTATTSSWCRPSPADPRARRAGGLLPRRRVLGLLAAVGRSRSSPGTTARTRPSCRPHRRRLATDADRRRRIGQVDDARRQEDNADRGRGNDPGNCVTDHRRRAAIEHSGSVDPPPPAPARRADHAAAAQQYGAVGADVDRAARRSRSSRARPRPLSVTAHNPTDGTVNAAASVVVHAASRSRRDVHRRWCNRSARVSRRARTYTIDATGIAPGHYTLKIEGVLTVNVTVS